MPMIPFASRDLDQVTLGIGSNDRDQQIQVKPKRIVTDWFNLTTRLDDVALIHVPNIGRQPLEKMSISIANLTATNRSEPRDLELIVAGWGDTNYSKSGGSHDLRATRMMLVDIGKCKANLLSHYKHVQISAESSFCLSNSSSTVCYVSLLVCPIVSIVLSCSNREILAVLLSSWGI